MLRCYKIKFMNFPPLKINIYYLLLIFEKENKFILSSNLFLCWEFL